MTEEEVLAAVVANPSPVDLKRKHNESEPLEGDVNQNGNKADDGEAVDAKRPRLDEEEKPESLVSENGFQADKTMEPAKREEEPSEEKNTETEVSRQTTEGASEALQLTSEEAPKAPKQTIKGDSEAPQQTSEEAPEGLDGKQTSTNDQQVADIQSPTGENLQLESENEKRSETEHQEPSAEEPRQVEPASENDSMSRKMEVPNDKVGVLIGKGGETIRYLQFNSGAKIQIMRDADVDPQSTNRPVELIGGLDNIKKAEKLIKDVIAEADAGGSPALVARGFGTAQAVGAVDQVLIQVPNEKVGVIIGKGGDTIKNLQTRSGARIQLIPQHLPEGDQSKERTVRVSGDKKQIERAREMIKEVMNQPPRQAASGGYNQQQSFRPRGPSSQQQWGSRGPNASHPSGYNDYQQRGYPSQNSQHQTHGYGNYPPRSGPRGNYNSGWERPPPMQGPPHQGGGGYDYYGPGPNHSNPHPSHGPGPNLSNMGPPSQGNYNYGQPHGQPTYPSQGYGQGYGENKYENQGPGYQQQPYSAPQPQYGKAPASYGVPPHGAPAQNYAQPRPTQQGDVPYQGGPAPVQQPPYGQSAVPPQPSYPYAGSGQVPQNYPPYAPAPGAEGYNQPQPAPASAQMYPQQSGHPVGQQAPGYAQVAGYSSYPAQQSYGDPSTQNNAAYGYNQGGTDPAYGGGAAYGAPMAGQVGYAQPVPAQQYDQSAPNPGSYGGVPAAQMYGAAPVPTPAPR